MWIQNLQCGFTSGLPQKCKNNFYFCKWTKKGIEDFLKEEILLAEEDIIFQILWICKEN